MHLGTGMSSPERLNERQHRRETRQYVMLVVLLIAAAVAGSTLTMVRMRGTPAVPPSASQHGGAVVGSWQHDAELKELTRRFVQLSITQLEKLNAASPPPSPPPPHPPLPPPPPPPSPSPPSLPSLPPPSPSSPPLSPPSTKPAKLAIFVVLAEGPKGTKPNYLSKSPEEEPWFLRSLRITRHSNPHASIYAVTVNSTLSNPYWMKVFIDLRVNVRFLETYHDSGLCRKLHASHLAYCKQVERRHIRGGCAPSTFFYDRWCYILQIAQVEGIERALGADADIPIYQDIETFIAQYTEDVVTVMPYTAQFTLINIKALAALHEFHIEFHQRDPFVTKQLTNESIRGRAFEDMETLEVFLDESQASRGGNISRHLLCRESTWPCSDHGWQAIENVMLIDCSRINHMRQACAFSRCLNMDQLKWIKHPDKDDMFLPTFNGTVLPAIHWQGPDCKRVLASNISFPFPLDPRTGALSEVPRQ